jgi:hypothetical protein
MQSHGKKSIRRLNRLARLGGLNDDLSGNRAFMAPLSSPGILWQQPTLKVADARLVVSSLMASTLFGGIVPGDLPAGEETD